MIKELGSGAYSIVYLASNSKTNLFYVKIIVISGVKRDK
jgi:hypothetical protein